MRNPPREFTEEEITSMAKMWQDGESQIAIAKAYSTTQPVVSRVLRPFNFRRHTLPRGAESPHWRGGRIREGGGYIGIYVPPEHPLSCMRSRMGYVKEHRLVMAQHLDRPLKKTENVHHINGIRDDNRIENLELWQTKQPKGTRVGDKHCATCTCSED